MSKHIGALWACVGSALARGSGAQQSRLIARLGVLCAILLGVLFLGARYIVGEGSGASLPAFGAGKSTVAPRFAFSINGVARPLGVAVSPTGDRIYVTESDGLRETKVFDRDGRPLGAVKPPDTEPATRTPVYVAASPQGKVYVSDRQAHAVHIYSPAGDYLGRVKPPDEDDGSWSPLALNFDVGGNLMVTDVSPGRHGVVIFGPDGSLLRRFGREGSGDGEFNYPNGVIADLKGRILVADSNNGRVAVFDPSAQPLWSFRGREVGVSLGLPRGLAIDDRNRLYVADTMNHNVLIFEIGEREARLLSTIGTNGIENGQFNFPNGLALDRSGRLYITDRENNRVQVWAY